MILDLTGGAGLVLLLVGACLAFVLDLPGGPAGWRVAGIGRRALIGVSVTVVLVALFATWARLSP